MTWYVEAFAIALGVFAGNASSAWLERRRQRRVVQKALIRLAQFPLPQEVSADAQKRHLEIVKPFDGDEAV